MPTKINCTALDFHTGLCHAHTGIPFPCCEMDDCPEKQVTPPAPEKTQGEQILDDFTEMKITDNADIPSFQVIALCAQARHQERAANALERIANRLEKNWCDLEDAYEAATEEVEQLWGQLQALKGED